MDDLLTLVPERWHPYLLLFFLFASVGSAALKLVLGDPKPGDSMLRRFAFGLAQALDWAAINSETVRGKLKRMRADLAARDEAEIAEAQRQAERGTTLTTAIDQHNMMTLLQEAEANAMSRLEAGAPPDIVEQERFRREMAIRRMTPAERKVEREELTAVMSKLRGAGVLVLVALLSMSSHACASSQARTVERHAAVVLASYAPIKAIKETVEARAHGEWDGIDARTTSEAEREQQRAALQERYAVVESALRTLVATYDSYVEAVATAHGDGTQVSSTLVLALLSRWQTFLDAARAMGIPVPDLPEELRGLVGAQ